MLDVLSVENMRKSDAYTIEHTTPSKELMYRAGLGVFEAVKWEAPVAVVCGSGNNAGDGFVIAKLLQKNNIDCTIFLLSEKFSEDGKYYFDQCTDAQIKTEKCSEETTFRSFNTVVDCIFGTGFKGNPRGLSRNIISAINSSNAYVVSVDINSGLNGDNGMAELCVKSDLTVSIGSFKSGHFLGMAKDVIKEKTNCDIGITPIDKPFKLLEKSDIKTMLPERKNLSNKGNYGYIALIGGSLKFSGAIRLAEMANACMRSGAGVVKLAVPSEIAPSIMPLILESTLFPLSCENKEIIFKKEEIDSLVKNVKTVAFGMGIGVSDGSTKILSYLLENYSGTLIVDADGLTILSKMDKAVFEKAKCRIVLTPHLKEFSRLTKLSIEEINEDPVSIARHYAKENNVVLLLKGPSTIITDKNETFITDTGCAGMATAGSGDVLSGIVSALCSFNDDITMAVAASAFINGMAGERAQAKTNQISMIASDTVSEIKNVITELSQNSSI